MEQLETFGYCLLNKTDVSPSLLDCYRKIKLKKNNSDDNNDNNDECCDSDIDVEDNNDNNVNTNNNKDKEHNNKLKRQRKELENKIVLHQDSYCRLIMSSVTGITEPKARNLMKQFSCPKLLYEYLSHNYLISNKSCLEYKFQSNKKNTKLSQTFMNVWCEKKSNTIIQLLSNDNELKNDNNDNNIDDDNESDCNHLVGRLLNNNTNVNNKTNKITKFFNSKTKKKNST